MIRKVVLPCAGLGTRFLPATKAQPKEMLPVFDRPAIQLVVEEALAAKLPEMLIVTGRGKEAIERHFDRSFELEHYLRKHGQKALLERVERVGRLADLHYVRQKAPKGLGDAIRCAQTFVGDEPFAVALADDLIYHPRRGALAQLVSAYQRLHAPIIAVERLPANRLSSYGVIAPRRTRADGYGPRTLWVEDVVEKPAAGQAPSNLAVVGRYVLTPDLFPVLERTPAGKRGEIQLTDALRQYLRNGGPLFAVELEGSRYDIGTHDGYLHAFLAYALREHRHPESLRRLLRRLL